VERDADLRERLVSHLEREGVLQAPAVAAAMRAVPRHRFIPSVVPEEAYADRAIAIKSSGAEIVSSISQPGMIAQMLELLEPQYGDHVLEIGTGSGYNAALLAELVGPSGRVTTVEVEPELAHAARVTLAELGYANVRVLEGDGTRSIGEFGASCDRMIVTARADDIAAAWWSALCESARLVVPLRLESAGEYAVGFVRSAEKLVGVGVRPCAFIALRSDDEATDAEIFYRDPRQRSRTAHIRHLGEIVAVRRQDATPELLAQADVVVARSVTMFALSFA
jgi:protein-L-isoaspartate(D-aspartate) O-methyltransferase